jgi:hypothetical protein
MFVSDEATLDVGFDTVTIGGFLSRIGETITAAASG